MKNAPIIYADYQFLYLEWPSHVQRFAFTEGGLSQALKLIPKLPQSGTNGFLSGGRNILDVPKLKGHIARKTKVAPKTQRQREVVSLSVEQRAKLSELVRKKFGN